MNASQAVNMNNCYGIPSGYATMQHELVIMDLKIGVKEKQHPKAANKIIKSWELKELQTME